METTKEIASESFSFIKKYAQYNFLHHVKDLIYEKPSSAKITAFLFTPAGICVVSIITAIIFIACYGLASGELLSPLSYVLSTVLFSGVLCKRYDLLYSHIQNIKSLASSIFPQFSSSIIVLFEDNTVVIILGVFITYYFACRTFFGFNLLPFVSSVAFIYMTLDLFIDLVPADNLSRYLIMFAGATVFAYFNNYLIIYLTAFSAVALIDSILFVFNFTKVNPISFFLSAVMGLKNLPEDRKYSILVILSLLLIVPPYFFRISTPSDKTTKETIITEADTMRSKREKAFVTSSFGSNASFVKISQ